MKKRKRKTRIDTDTVDFKPEKQIQINVRVTPQLHELLKYEAWKQRTSLNKYILIILEKREKIW